MVTNINTCTSLSSQVRQAADIKNLTVAQKMANHFNRKKCVKLFCVEDKVSVRIPRIAVHVQTCLGYHVLGGVQGIYRLQ